MNELNIVTEVSTCTKCKETKPYTRDFFHKTGYKNGLRRDCKDCVNTNRRTREFKDVANATKRKRYKECNTFRDKCRNSNYKSKFNITIEEYNKLFSIQEGFCKLCNVHQSNIKKRFAVDHCHKTEKETGEILVRGLLCDNCNKGLGHFKDNLKTINKSIRYLKGEL